MTPSRDQKERCPRIDPFLFFGIFSSFLALCFSSCDKSPTPSRLSDSTPKTAEQVWTEISPSLIYVAAVGFDGTKAQGSGFIVELEGKRLILTNRHVVKGAEKVMVGTDAEKLLPSASYKIATDLDLAVVECPDTLKAPPLRLATRTLNPGAEVIALGFPLGLSKVITRGVVSAVEDHYVLFDAPISSGNSGGPVVNQFGEVIGVATMGSQSRGTAVVQNLNVGIRVSAIPNLPVFQDPVLRLSTLSDRVREVEAFIERGYREGDYFALQGVLALNWFTANQSVEDLQAQAAEQEKARSFAAKIAATQKQLESKPGGVRAAVEKYVAFLKECEIKINALPDAFGSLGNDPVLAAFLKAERKGGWFASSGSPQGATPELLPKLARISADHWLARVEDHRFRLEWALRYTEGMPSLPRKRDWEAAAKALETKERPSIRLHLALTGDKVADLNSYLSTVRNWEGRMDVIRDLHSHIARRQFLAQVSDFRQQLAAASADRGKFEEALSLLRNDLKSRPASCNSGALLADFLALSGQSDEAWKAYAAHYSAPNYFDAFAITKKARVKINGDLTVMNLFRWAFPVEGLRLHGFRNQPLVLENARQWNEQAATVEGRRFTDLPSLKEVVTSKWFESLSRLSRIRVLYYFHFFRAWDSEQDQLRKLGAIPKRDYSAEWAEFLNSLDASPEARALWDEISSGEDINPLL